MSPTLRRGVGGDVLFALSIKGESVAPRERALRKVLREGIIEDTLRQGVFF